MLFLRLTGWEILVLLATDFTDYTEKFSHELTQIGICQVYYFIGQPPGVSQITFECLAQPVYNKINISC